MIRLGQRLHQERIRKGLSLQDVSRATKIQPSFIMAIEKGEYHKISSPSYAKGFVRNYAQFLGLPTKEVLALFRREFDTEKSYKVLPETYTKKQDIVIKRTKIRFTLLALFGILLMGGVFLLYQYRSAFFSPSLVIETPTTAPVSAPEVVVSGKTEPSATLTVNNEPVALDPEGNFRKTVTVFPGKATITIRSVNRLGKETMVEKIVDVRE